MTGITENPKTDNKPFWDKYKPYANKIQTL